jgi:acyl-coenzyme A synthetase/AMP-(fatty) acid ligase
MILPSQPFPISHRLTPQAVVHLLMKASCHHLMLTSATLPTELVNAIKQEVESHHPTYKLSVTEMPSPSYIYPNFWGIATSDSLYPSPSQRSCPDHLALCFHSSGSTNLPKLVPNTNRIACSWAILSKSTVLISRLCPTFSTTHL